MATRRKTRPAKLAALKEPGNVTLVDLPANRAAFKVRRSAKGKEKAVQRSEEGLIAILLPEGTTKEQADRTILDFGLEDGYEVVLRDDGRYMLVRIDAESSGSAVQVALGGGYTAQIDSSFIQQDESATVTASRNDSPDIPGVKLVSLEFDERYDLTSVKGWLEKNEIDFKPDGVQQVEGGVIVRRADVEENAMTRSIHLGEGVTAIVTRADQNSVPDSLYRTVVETAYGNWGWGHLDFFTAMADPQYSEKSFDAIYILRDVLETILLHSALPLDERQALMSNALSEFEAYMSAVIAAVPRSVMQQMNQNSNDSGESAQRSAPTQKEEAVMATEETKAAREDDAATATASGNAANTEENTASAEAETATDKEQYVTRSELKDIVAESVKAALAEVNAQPEVKEEEANRGDSKDGTDAATGDADQTAQIAAAINKFSETVEKLVTRIDGVEEKVKEVESTAVARSDGEGSAESGASTGDVFAGAFGSLGGLRS